MNILHTAPRSSPSPFNDFVATDFSALASHMNSCKRSGGRLFHLRFLLEKLHGLAAPRIVTSGAFVLACVITLASLA